MSYKPVHTAVEELLHAAHYSGKRKLEALQATCNFISKIQFPVAADFTS